MNLIKAFLIVCCLIIPLSHAWAQSQTGSDVTKSVSVHNIVGREAEYHYLSMSKPSPFIPPLISTLMARVELPIESPLQKFPLSDLKIVGVWTLRNGEMKSMVMTPLSEGIVVEIGALIGRRGGKIVAIDESSITVREFSLASDGSRQFEDAKLWIENGEPVPEDKIVIRSNKAGVPNHFGYGKKNYTNSPTYEDRHQDILKRLDEQHYDKASPDDGRPDFVPKDNSPSATKVLTPAEENQNSVVPAPTPSIPSNLTLPAPPASATTPMPEGAKK